MDIKRAFSSYSVDDLDGAERFYSDTLRLKVSRDKYGLELRPTDDHTVFVYPKDDHEPATFTVLNLVVADVQTAASELSGRGITFERYPAGEMDVDDIGVHRGGGMTIAWFRDPAGNYLSLIEE
jgi:catechol 2,3-dioxygenase-like lactoylglutathione lyase family enzyme